MLSEISQHRKQRVKIVATSQVYSRVVKPIREQTFSVVQCQTIAGRWTMNKEYDARDYEAYCESSAQDKKLAPLGKRSFIQSDWLRARYDTYQKIERLQKVDFIPRDQRGNA